MNHLLGQINAGWRPHEHCDDEDRPGECLAVGIDPRCIPDPDYRERRMMVTFGPNPFHGWTSGVMVPILPNEYVFGIHLVGVEGDTVRVYDQWDGVIPATGRADAATLSEVMAAVSDEAVRHVLIDPQDRERNLKLEFRPVENLDRLTLARAG